MAVNAGPPNSIARKALLADTRTGAHSGKDPHVFLGRILRIHGSDDR